MTQSYGQYFAVLSVSVSQLMLHKRRDSHQVFGQHLMNNDADGEMSERLRQWHPQVSGGANIIRCVLCFYPTDELARYCD